MPAWRCTTCAISWPVGVERRLRPPIRRVYDICPQCLGRCDPIADAPTVDMDTALILKLWAEFERYYAARDPSGDPVESVAA